MNIISIDVGIKNLAYCLFSLSKENVSFKVEKWGVIDLSQKTEVQKKCTCYNEKKPTKKNPKVIKEKCTFLAKWKKEDECYCVKHAKKSNFMIPTKQTSIPFITKQKMEYLHKLITQFKIVLEENKKLRHDKLKHLKKKLEPLEFTDNLKHNLSILKKQNKELSKYTDHIQKNIEAVRRK